MQDRVDVTVPMESKLKDAIEDQLGYNDSKAEFIRQAVIARLREMGVDTDGLHDLDGE